MVIYNAATKELTAKIVYYGPGLCGKTTNLKVLHDRLEPGTAGKLLNLQTQTDRTIYFDLLPVELGDIKGYKIRFQLATVPGQTAFNETRRVVLKGVDGIVFVADSQWTMLPKNLESWQNLKDNLKSNEITFESIPVVIQYNKRDLADILAVDAMQEALGLSSYPYVEAVASAGRGVTETFKLISKLTFVDLLRRLQGRRAEEDAAAAASEDGPRGRSADAGRSRCSTASRSRRPSHRSLRGSRGPRARSRSFRPSRRWRRSIRPSSRRASTTTSRWSPPTRSRSPRPSRAARRRRSGWRQSETMRWPTPASRSSRSPRPMRSRSSSIRRRIRPSSRPKQPSPRARTRAPGSRASTRGQRPRAPPRGEKRALRPEPRGLRGPTDSRRAPGARRGDRRERRDPDGAARGHGEGRRRPEREPPLPAQRLSSVESDASRHPEMRAGSEGARGSAERPGRPAPVRGDAPAQGRGRRRHGAARA